MSSIDPKEFRNALGAFATGVTIITAHNKNGGYVGVTVNSFNSVSVEPPMVLWSLDNRSGTLEAFLTAKYFSVNVLAADQVSLSNRFASRMEDKFEGAEYQLGAGDTPLIEGCAARFLCRNKFQYEGGDHTIFIGEVEEFDNFDRRALLYHQGTYAVSDPHPVSSSGTSDQEIKGGFVDDYLHYLLVKAGQVFEQHFQPVLEDYGISHNQWRVLATLSDQTRLDAEAISETVVLPLDELAQLCEKLQKKDLITKGNRGYSLTDAGEETTVELLAAAKAHEADAMGTFNVDQAEMLKSSLKQLVEWVGTAKNQYQPVRKS